MARIWPAIVQHNTVGKWRNFYETNLGNWTAHRRIFGHFMCLWQLRHRYQSGHFRAKSCRLCRCDRRRIRAAGHPVPDDRRRGTRSVCAGLLRRADGHFDAEKVETNGKNITVFWADTASFFSDTGTKAEATAELAFQDFASQLQFMLDSTYVTLTKNLDVTNVYYVTSTGTPLDFTEQANWTLSADQFYSGTFGDYYLDETTDGGNASNPDKDGKEFIFLDQRADPAASGADLSPEAAAQSVYDALVLDYKGDTDEREWVIALDEITQVDGSEAYAFSVGQGTEETFDTYFHAAITYDGNVYMMENGASEYSSYDQPET